MLTIAAVMAEPLRFIEDAFERFTLFMPLRFAAMMSTATQLPLH